MPRFKATHNDLELLAIVADVAHTANPEEPTAVSTRAWDAAREQAGHATAPRAKSISQRLGVQWAKILRTALASPATHSRMLRTAQSGRERQGLTLEHVRYVIARAQLASGGRLTRASYEANRRSLLDRSRTRAQATRIKAAVPSLNQIDEVLSQHTMKWGQLLTDLGIAIQDGSDTRHLGASILDAVRAFINDTGAQPANLYALNVWGDLQQIGRSAKFGTKDFAETMMVIDKERDAEGLSALEAINSQKVRTLKLDPEAVAHLPNTKHTSGNPWTEAELIKGLTEALRHLPPGKNLTHRDLKRLARDTRGKATQRIPGAKAVNGVRERTGHTWEHYREAAEAALRDELMGEE